MANLTYEQFMEYDKLSDDVYILGRNVVLKLNAILIKIPYNGSPIHFYKEYEYPSKAKKANSISVRRSFDYYLSLENIVKPKGFSDRAFIRIGPSEQFHFKMMTDEAVSWFIDPKYADLFIKVNGKLILASGDIPSVSANIFPQGKYISIYPIVIDNGEGIDMLKRGVRLVLSDENNYVDMDFEKLLGLKSITDYLNLYAVGQGLVNYASMPYGLNRTTLGGVQKSNSDPSIEGANGRMIDPITLDDM